MIQENLAKQTREPVRSTEQVLAKGRRRMSVRGVIKIKVGQNLKGEVSCVKCFRKGKPSKS